MSRDTELKKTLQQQIDELGDIGQAILLILVLIKEGYYSVRHGKIYKPDGTPL